MKKKPRGLFLFPRFLAGLLIAGQLTLGLPAPSFALRPVGLEEANPAVKEQILQSLRKSGLEEKVPITIEGPDGPITWEVPAEVAQAIAAIETSALTREEGERMLRGLLEEASKHSGDEIYGGPEHHLDYHPRIIFWLLEYLYDPRVNLSQLDRAQFERGIYEDFIPNLASGSLDTSALDVFSYDDFGDHAIEAWWYLLLRTILIEARLETAREPLLQQQLVIQNAYRTILHWHSHAFHTGLITLGKDFFEGRLIQLAKVQPGLRGPIGQLLQNWDDWVADLPVTVGSPEGESQGFETPSGEDVVKQARVRQQLDDQLVQLRAIVTPRTPETAEVWDRPISYLVKRSQEVTTVVFDHSAGDSPSERVELPNGWLFLLDWLDRMADIGFTQWAMAGSLGMAGYVESLHRWINTDGTDRDLQSFLEKLQAYLDSRGEIPIRLFLALPRRQEPPEVTRAIKFWEMLRQLKRDRQATLTLFDLDVWQALEDPEDAFALWLKADGRRILVSVGSLYPPRAYLQHIDSLISIIHKRTIPRYRYERFQAMEALRYVGHQIGETRGWGDRRSAAIPIRDNQPLAEFMQEGALEAAWAIWSGAGIGNIGPAHDALVITSEPEGDESEEPWAPAPEEVLAPGPRVLVPAGSRGGLEERQKAWTSAQESWHGMRSQARQVTPVVISRVAQEMHPQLKALGGLEEKSFILDQGDLAATIVELIKLNATSAVFVGLEEEAEHFAPMAQRSGITTRTISPRESDFSKLILRVLSQATGLEETFLETQHSFKQFVESLTTITTGA